MGKIVGVVMILLVVLGSAMEIKCNLECKDVVANFDWCTGYVEGLRDEPGLKCCENLRTLNAIAKREGPRRICQCIQFMASHQLGIPYIASRISDLYVKCHIHLSFPISQSMDCSKV